MAIDWIEISLPPMEVERRVLLHLEGDNCLTASNVRDAFIPPLVTWMDREIRAGRARMQRSSAWHWNFYPLNPK